MAHKEQIEFCRRVREKYPEWFRAVRVLDIGSYDVNGNNRFLFDGGSYHGVDLVAGPNVDTVCPAHEFEEGRSFDVVISTEALEHDLCWPKTLRAMARLCRPGGLVLFTCATTGREEHGTARRMPSLSPGTTTRPDWKNHYRNLTERDVRSALDVEALFSEFAFEVDRGNHDLYFYGIRRTLPCDSQSSPSS